MPNVGHSSTSQNQSNTHVFPEIRNSLSSENPLLSPKIQRHFEKIHAYERNCENNEFENLEFEELEINPKKVEGWIGGALRDAMNKGYVKKEAMKIHKSVLRTFGIDRETLLNNDLDAKNINRLYRALYVYSLGFYELLKEPLKRSKNRKSVLTSLWKVYSVLLQYV